MTQVLVFLVAYRKKLRAHINGSLISQYCNRFGNIPGGDLGMKDFFGVNKYALFTLHIPVKWTFLTGIYR